MLREQPLAQDGNHRSDQGAPEILVEERTVNLSALISCGLLVVLGLTSAWIIYELKVASQLVAHTHEVLGSIEGFLGHTTTAESLQRRYIITDDVSAREAMSQEIVLASQALDELQRLTLNIQAQKRIQLIRDLLKIRIGILREGIVVFEQSGLTEVQHWLRKGQGVKAMNDICAACLELKHAEEDLLRTRSLRTDRIGMMAFICIGVITISGVATSLIARRVIRRSLARRHLLEARLQETNVGLERQVEERTREISQQARRLEEANKGLESFSYSVSHDLRAPLRSIDGFSMVLERTLSGIDPDSLRRLGLIRQAATQMNQLITDLLAFSRLGRAEMSKSVVDMRHLVRECYNDLTAMRGSRSVAFTVSDSLPSCRGDSALIKQIVLNLLGNAIKYSGKRDHPTVSVTWAITGKPPGSVTPVAAYCVADNGAGFDMRYYHKLFGVFQRLHRAEEFEGTGVGLATVKHIVERHGGIIWATSELGVGSSFYFTIGGSST